MKRVIINADDFGYSNSINSGILEAINNGVVSSTSVMVYGAAVKETEVLKNMKNISIGLHLHIDNPNADFEKEIIKQIYL